MDHKHIAYRFSHQDIIAQLLEEYKANLLD